MTDGPFGPSITKWDNWQDKCAEAMEIARLVRRHPEYFTEEFKRQVGAADWLPKPPNEEQVPT